MNYQRLLIISAIANAVLLSIILWPTEEVQTSEGQNEVYREIIVNLQQENDSLKSLDYKQGQIIDSLNKVEHTPKQRNEKRFEKIDSIPDDSLDIELHRMLDSLGAVFNS